MREPGKELSNMEKFYINVKSDVIRKKEFEKNNKYILNKNHIFKRFCAITPKNEKVRNLKSNLLPAFATTDATFSSCVGLQILHLCNPLHISGLIISISLNLVLKFLIILSSKFQMKKKTNEKFIDGEYEEIEKEDDKKL